MEDNEQPPAPIMEASAPQVVERPLWELSRDEQRVLIITFVGGLASIVAGVCIVGGAIALARWLRTQHLPLGFLILFTAIYIFSVTTGSTGLRESLRRGSSKRWPRHRFILWLCLLVGLSMMLLVWIGLAAGIH